MFIRDIMAGRTHGSTEQVSSVPFFLLLFVLVLQNAELLAEGLDVVDDLRAGNNRLNLPPTRITKRIMPQPAPARG